MPPRIARLAGLGAFGAIAAFVALFAFLVYLTIPRPTGGMDMILAWVSWISLATLFAGLVGAHIVLGKQLLQLAKGSGPHDL